MKAPKWLDREHRIHSLSVQLRAKTSEGKLWFRQYLRLTGDLTVARATVATRDDEIALMNDICTEEMNRAERLRLAWTSARARAVQLGRRLDVATVQLQVQRTEHFAAIRELQDERQALHRAATQGIVRAPSTFAPSPDRDNANLLAAENSKLRARVAELEAKYEGNPS